jgi:N-acyl-D-amino-acid deacylase
LDQRSAPKTGEGVLDILVKNCDLVDGFGTRRYRADVGIQGDRIADVGQLSAAEARTVIDATGCVVTPGFVDIHSHADFTLPVGPTADSLVHQGITTAIVGQCGASPAPRLGKSPKELVATLGALLCFDGMPWDQWDTYGSYLDYLREIGTSINLVPLVGQGTIRVAVMGAVSDRASDEQITQMQAEVVRAVEHGAIGISSGLIYPPGCYTSTEELIELTRPVGERNGYYFSHIRGEADTLLDAVAEAIQIGRETGAAVEISHFEAQGRDNWPKQALALELINEARAEGLDVTADMYPYLACSTSLSSFLPRWAVEGGTEVALERLSGRGTRESIAEQMRHSGDVRFAQRDKVTISRSPHDRSLEGRHVTELAAEAGQSVFNWIFDTLFESRLEIEMIYFAMCEEDRSAALRHPAMMIGTDGLGLASEGPLSEALRHPRSYGTFPRVLSRYVRELGVISLEEAVHKMTGLPAKKLRWSDRGLIRPGYAADLVVLRPDIVQDSATFEHPHQYPKGIQHVIVNGKTVIGEGVHTKSRPGLVLTH